MTQVISKKILADVSEACMGAGILSTCNLAGSLQIIKSLKILPAFDFSERKVHFSHFIGPKEEKMRLMVSDINQYFKLSYADLLDHSKLQGTKTELNKWLKK